MNKKKDWLCDIPNCYKQAPANDIFCKGHRTVGNQKQKATPRTINIIGKGPSAKKYNTLNDLFAINLFINDSAIKLYFNFNLEHYYITTDKIQRFGVDRLNQMAATRPTAIFAADYFKFKKYFTDLKVIPLNATPKITGPENLLNDITNIRLTDNTATAAIQAAVVYLQATRVILYGVDFSPEWAKANGYNIEKVKQNFSWLRQAAESKGIELITKSDTFIF